MLSAELVEGAVLAIGEVTVPVVDDSGGLRVDGREGRAELIVEVGREGGVRERLGDGDQVGADGVITDVDQQISAGPVGEAVDLVEGVDGPEPGRVGGIAVRQAAVKDRVGVVADQGDDQVVEGAV
ncbi:hypothetical protein GS489_06665 [Rhodococcus hoagii]|nr:hypothetical protein [Prescottella equi]